MSNTYGYEIEFHVDDEDNLADYLSIYSDTTDLKFGVDGAGISTLEIRSSVYNDLNLIVNDLIYSLSKIDVFNPNFNSFILKDGFLLTNSLHLSLGLNNSFNLYKLYLCYFILYPLWLLFKSPKSFIRYLIRLLVYPEIYIIHTDRLEIRFLSSELPVESIWVIKFIHS